MKRKNPIYERAKFNLRRQEEEESVDTFTTSLHCLSEHCGYEGLRNEMIRDRIVVGIRDANLSMKLQIIPDLDLEKAVAAARQSEAVRQQQGVVRGDPSVVDNVDSHKKRKNVQNKGSNQKQHSSHVPIPSPAQPPQSHKCTRCGKSPVHSRKSALQSMKHAISVAKRATTSLCARQGKLHTWKWILMVLIHT